VVRISRLLAEKGINEFLKAAELVRSKHQSISFIVLGGLDNSNPGSVETNFLNRLIDKEIVIYPGQVEDVKEWLRDSSVFVLPSYREGMPRSTQEAMAIGRPVITTDVPGCRETVIDGLNGFKVAPFSSTALVEAMVRFINGPQLVSEMGLHSRRLAEEHFNADKVNERLITMLGL